MMFINKTKLILPKSKIILQTNGFYLDQILAKEYEKNGVNIIRISAYSQKEYIRLSKIKLKIPIIVTMQILDDRLNIRSHLEIDNKKPCYAPLNEIIVTNEGKISLCCLDWERKYIFGDLYKQTLKEILQNKKIFEVYKKLSTGNRFLDICKKCDWQR